jgi:hypothetical protein
VERRQELRIAAYQLVDLILLGDDAKVIAAHATQFSGSGLRLVLKQPVSRGTLVKVQGDDWLMLGEVCYCRKERLNFVVGLQLEHSLTGLEELEKLNRKLMGEKEMPAAVPELLVLHIA